MLNPEVIRKLPFLWVMAFKVLFDTYVRFQTSRKREDSSKPQPTLYILGLNL
jgi:hypothetical protein